MSIKQFVAEVRLTKKMKSTFEDKMNLLFFIGPFGILFFGVSTMIANFNYRLEVISIFGSLLIIILGILLAHFVYKRLKQNQTFEVIENENILCEDALIEKIKIDFRIKKIWFDWKNGYIEFDTNMKAFSWGERITVIKDGEFYLVNSRPVSSRQPFTICKDRKNIEKLRKIIRH